MRKLITFLGTTAYTDCHYIAESGEKAEYGRFVQPAILSLFAQGWSRNDKMIMCLTKEAREKNWLDRSVGDQIIEGLQSVLQKHSVQITIEVLEIESDFSERSQWKLFHQLVDAIDPEDTVYFDVTNSFRTFPVMAMMVWSYARTIKNASLGNIWYGNFEALGFAYQVKDLPPEQRLAPIVDLTHMASLYEWTIGVDQFIRYGNSAALAELTQRTVQPILKSTMGGDREARILRGLAGALTNFSLALTTCRANGIRKEADKLREKLRELKQFELEKYLPLVKLIDKMEDKVNQLDGNHLMEQYLVAQWCLDHDLIQQGITILSESVVTVICHEIGCDERKKKNRKLVNSVMQMVMERADESKWQIKKEEHSTFLKLKTYIETHRDYLQHSTSLIEARNDINHAGTTRGVPLKGKKFRDVLSACLQSLKPFFERVSGQTLHG